MHPRQSFSQKVLLIFVLGSLLFSSPANLSAAAQGVTQTSQPVDNPSTIYLPITQNVDEGGWKMAGANPQRTSWTSDEVPGQLKPLWYKVFDAYIPPKVQVITSYNTLYIATSKGLYALDAASGAEKWVYPTEMPLGHSPTVESGVVYAGGFDHKLHAINAFTGDLEWQFEAGAGFDTNPLVVNDLVMAGNRDGYFYAIHAGGPQRGQLAWRFKTDGPIDYSAAYAAGVVYFASQDSYAYALNAQNGSLVWKSDKLPGSGFQSWWPVVYGDWVIFSGSNNYREGIQPGEPGSGSSDLITTTELREIFPNYFSDPRGRLAGPLGNAPGNWAAGTPTIDLSKPEPSGTNKTITKYFEEKPYRRTYLVLSRSNGAEYTTDFDHNGKPEYAPLLWLGTHSGNRYPPVVGIDGVLYQSSMYMSDPWIAGGQIVGWQIGTPYISVVSSDWTATDEPQAYAAGGRSIYWNLCCDRESGVFDVTRPNALFQNRYNSGVRPATDAYDSTRERKYYEYNLQKLIPGYNALYYNGTVSGVYSGFGGRNGVYGYHGLQNPPIPYKGKVYMHRSNAVIAFSANAGAPVHLPNAQIHNPPPANVHVPTKDEIKNDLAEEVQKMIQAGHLRPGYFSTGLLDIHASRYCGDDLLDYWHFPGDTVITLLQALPYLPPALQDPAKAYIQSEFTNYLFPPKMYNHVGWKSGAAREPFIVPLEPAQFMQTVDPWPINWEYAGWERNPLEFYAAWKYALVFGNAKGIFDAIQGERENVPPDAYLAEFPGVHNAYIGGYLGFLELQKLAGYPEDAAVRQTLNRLISLRSSTFTKDNPDAWFYIGAPVWDAKPYCRSFSVSRNFMYMVPEAAGALRANALNKVSAALQEYDYVAPYWFAVKPETAFGEGAIDNFYNRSAVFQARARILQSPYAELTRYLDVPAVPTGDLFYIQNLIAALDAGS